MPSGLPRARLWKNFSLQNDQLSCHVPGVSNCQLTFSYTPLHGEAHIHALCDTVMLLPLDTDNSGSFIHSNDIGHPYHIRRITHQRSDTSWVDFTRELDLPYLRNRAS
jgi:hypothetical protein